MIRITVPIAATMPTGQKAAVYTQSEAWTPDRIGELRTWIANLREVSDVAVVVASRVSSPDPTSAPEVATWLHLPYDTLKTSETAASAAASTNELPLLPCLKEAKWRGREHTVCRALWESESSQFMPWVAVGYDHPHTFEFINTDKLPELKTTEKALEAQALANLRARPATWEPVDVDVKGSTLRILTCSGDYFAAEHVLDPVFMQQGQRTLKAHGLFVGVPRRGLLMATAAGQDQQMIAAFGAAVAGQFSRGETAVISPMLFAMKDDANAPIINALVTRNDRGTEDVHLMAAGHDGDRLAKGIEIGFMSLLNEHMAREAFSGHIQIVVLSMTPPDARKQIPKLVEHLRGICNDVSKDGTKRYRVTLTFQKDSQSTSNAPPATAVPAAVAAPTERTKRHRAWVRPTRWVVLLAVAPLLYVAFNWPSVHAYPNTIEYGTVQLSQATRWQRSGTSAAVYVPPGEEMPDASLQLGVLVSAEHATAADLLAWIRDQSRGPDNHRYHDSGTASETCVVGVSSQPVHRTYLALQMCKTGKSRAACVEWDHVLEEDVFGSCQNDKSCFDDECSGRWQEQRDNLDSVLARFLSDAKNTGAKAQVRAD